MTLGGRTTGSRYDIVGHARFLTFSCVDRAPLFGDAFTRDIFAARLASVNSRLGIALHAWVLMPEHAHLCVLPGAAGQTRQFLEQLKSGVARSILHHWRQHNDPRVRFCARNTGNMFWQPGGGYDRTLRDTREAYEKIGYIHANPVRRGLVGLPEEWVWSSARWCAGHRDGSVQITRLNG